VPIIGFYFLYFASVGILLPFLPGYLQSLQLSSAEIGALLAVSPAFALAAPQVWGHVADRWGRPARVLSILAFGACACFAPVLFVDRFPLLLLALCAYAFFATAITSIIDSLALQQISAGGGSFARLRLFGSLGFVFSSTLFGLASDEVGFAAVVGPLLLMGAYTLWSFTLRPPVRPRARPASRGGLHLLRQRDLLLFLCGSCLHWIACAPYHGMLALHIGALGLPPWVVGLSAGLGVVAEVGVMFLYPRFADRLAPRHVLFAAYFASSLRWMGMALARDEVSIIALSPLHGLTFGAFYVAGVAYVARWVPLEWRATGQALFASATFGIGGLVGYLSAGSLFDALGGPMLFGVAAVVEVVPALLALLLRAPPETESLIK
jgi:PPP family 3-phenylpropionic acid transporter